MTPEITTWAEALADADRRLALLMQADPEANHGDHALAGTIRHLAAIVHHARLLAIGAGAAADLIALDLRRATDRLETLVRAAHHDRAIGATVRDLSLDDLGPAMFNDLHAATDVLAKYAAYNRDQAAFPLANLGQAVAMLVMSGNDEDFTVLVDDVATAARAVAEHTHT